MRIDLKHIRKTYGLTQEQAGRVFGVKQSAWSKFETDYGDRGLPDYFARLIETFMMLNEEDRDRFVNRM